MYLELYDGAIDCVTRPSPLFVGAERVVDIGERCLTYFMCRNYKDDLVPDDRLTVNLMTLMLFIDQSQTFSGLLEGKKVFMRIGEDVIVVGLDNNFYCGPLRLNSTEFIEYTKLAFTAKFNNADGSTENLIWGFPGHEFRGMPADLKRSHSILQGME